MESPILLYSVVERYGLRMSRKLLVFIACYNESKNINRLIDEIVAVVPEAHILIVDDSSPDGTWDIVESKKKLHHNLWSVKRPRKLGIGTAHKYALFFAMRKGFDTLVTMDADFSHSPSAIPALLAAHEKNTFVTGSRYCEGGKSDYTGYRDIVSRIGNAVARSALGLDLRELTTYFRVFDIDSLRRIPLRNISAVGYSYGVQLVYYLGKAGVKLREVPIHFVDRTHGASKIPRLQILWSAIDLAKLALRRLNGRCNLEQDHFVWDTCPNCGDRALAMKHFGVSSEPGTVSPTPTVDAYRCTSVGARSYPPVYVCLCCGLEQIPASLVPSSGENPYTQVVDTAYLENIPARKRTFRRCLERIAQDLPKSPGRLLEIGAYCGLFLKEAEKRGWEGDGVELSACAAAYARDKMGVNVLQGFLEQNRSKLRSRYDLVVAWDVLEHVPDPSHFIKDCGEFLPTGGLFCFSTLDIDNWLPRLLGTRWPWLMDMHRFYFDRHILKDILDRCGFDLLRAEPYVHYATVSYALNGVLRILPQALRESVLTFSRLIPRFLVVPFAFGDIKLYVARKR
jgi:SAM-dependent methyltransferase